MRSEARRYLIRAAAALLSAAIHAWIFSMIWDALGTQYPDMPHIDFWAALGILWLVGLIGAALRSYDVPNSRGGR